MVPQELNIDSFFTPRELLELQAGFYGVPKAERRTDELLATARACRQGGRLARTLSGGMRRRLMVAKAMVHAPPVLVLDEPTAGVDVELRQQLWTHAERSPPPAPPSCSPPIISRRRRSCATASPSSTTAAWSPTTPRRRCWRKIDDKLLTLSLVKPVSSLPPGLAALGLELDAPERLVFRYQPSRAHVGDVLAAVEAAGLAIRDVTSEETDLEDIFLRLTGAMLHREPGNERGPKDSPDEGAADSGLDACDFF